jgi:hypothetical protein
MPTMTDRVIRLFGMLIVAGLMVLAVVTLRPKPPPPQTAEQKARASAELRADCFAYYGRMCRDETEALMAGFRSGFNKGPRRG